MSGSSDNHARPLGVGIIGANPDRGWARDAHIPALAALDDFDLRAVSTSRPESARAAARQFGVEGFDSHQALVGQPDVDLVVITVKVPAHRALVTAALEAGKHVLCEWPLGNGLAEAQALADLAGRSPGRAFVGLQARSSPVIRYVRDLVADGYVGEVLATTLTASGMAWGNAIDNANAYINDRDNGASLLTIPFGHAVDALCWCLGEFDSLTSTLATRQPWIVNADTGEKLPRTVADQVVVSGRLSSGTVAAIHYRGGASRGDNLLWTIHGTDGELMLRAGHGHLQIAGPRLYGARGSDTDLAGLDTPSYYSRAPRVPAGPAFNVGQAYAGLAADIRNGTNGIPGFDDAVNRHRLIEEISAGRMFPES
jgi:predicted dehydrogenase